MKVNEGKTKVMVFRASHQAPKLTRPLMYNLQQLEVVEEFKFLGIPLTADVRHAATNTANALAKAANKSYGAMWARAREAEVEDFTSLRTLFEACVLSVASYGCTVFTPFLPDVDDKPDPTEQLHLRFLRAALGVPRWTPKVMLYVETGRLPLRIDWLVRAAAYFFFDFNVHRY